MKKLLAVLLIMGSMLTIMSCDNPDNLATTTDTSATTEMSTETTSPLFLGEMHANVDYEVKIIGKDGTVVIPLEEHLNRTSSVFDMDGNISVLYQHTYLSPEMYLTQNAELIPLITLDQDSEIIVTVSENGYVTPSKASDIRFYVYCEDDTYDENYPYRELAHGLTLDEILEKGKAEWNGKTVYLSFSLTFTEPHYGIEDWIEKRFHVKTVF